ncbi:SHOCT domain-containing protein [Halapricum hydrolyticum]|uniref:SHOCT domain-containing protein n=1 Tax=Halapricum hydrolyticum TaxID=2979991 RepID=A0AAE3ID36_9EURY|nr:hypothetical protein [Halapricum hydrolyticum]MCU4719352.1 hypothetical protein [Halapricum hydrolyticum]MCU4728383.1 hypothetical protein [Halapricum hydrolyticum]
MNEAIQKLSTGRLWPLALLALVGGLAAVTATSSVFWVFVAGLVGVGVLWLLSGRSAPLTTDHDTASDAEDAVETLKQQYATGEIDEMEFERRLERLLETGDDLDGGSYPGETRSARAAQTDGATTRQRGESDDREQEPGAGSRSPRQRSPDRPRCGRRGKRPRGRHR